MTRTKPVTALLLVLLGLLLPGCRQEQPLPPAVTRIGHSRSPLLGTLYAATAAQKSLWQLVDFRSSSDVGYALLSGDVDAGFVETDKTFKLLAAPGGDGLILAGSIKFPYGATLVLRGDLNLRLAELKGRHLAALEPDCVINRQFRTDARRFGLDPDTLAYSYIPFVEILPALEAKTIDGALVKGAYGVLAELAGHKILYQNWEVAGGDDCCPAILNQTEFLLVVRKTKLDRVTPLIQALAIADSLPASELRAVTASRLGYPQAALERFPVASFALIDEATRKTLGANQCAIIR